MRYYIRFCVICAAVAGLARADSFWWKGGGDYRPFGDANWWGVGQGPEAVNPEGLTPGAGDDISYGPATLAFDMEGGERHVRALVSGASDSLWDRRYMYVRNGTLKFLESFTNVCLTVNVASGGCFALGGNCATRFGLSAASADYDIQGEAVLQGRMSVECLRATVRPDGALTFAPQGAVLIPKSHSSAIPTSFLENSGRLNIPDGIAFSAGGTAGNSSGFEIRQKAGTLALGGVFAKPAACHDDFRLKISGGTLSATGDVAFSNLTELAVAAGVSLPVEVASGKVLNLRGMTFGTGASVSKTGEGTLSLGERAPDALTVAEGTLALDNTEFNSVEIGERARVAVVPDLRAELAVAFGTEDVLGSLKSRLEDAEAYEIRDGGLFRASSREPQTFYWKAAESYGRYEDPSLWGLGTSADAANQDGAVPGLQDFVAFRSADIRLDLGGHRWRIGGLDGATASGWTAYAFEIRNGALEATSCFTNFYKVAVGAGGHLATGAHSAAKLGKGGVCNTYNIGPAGRVDLAGAFTFQHVRATVSPNARMSFRPSQAIAVPPNLFDEVGVSYFENNGGTLSIPAGFSFGPGGRRDKNPATFEVRQRDGDLLLGGVFARDSACHYNVRMLLSGGLVKAVDDVAFVDLTELAMTAGAAVTNRVAAGSVCDFSPMAFGTGATLVKQGEGTLRLGAGRPNALLVEKGVIDFAVAGNIGEGLELRDGSTLRISVSGLAAKGIAGLESAGVAVSVADALKRKRTVIFRSGNPNLLDTLKRKLEAPPEGFEYRIVGESLSYERKPTGFLLTVR